MAYMTLNRNYLLRSIFGVIRFTKGEPLWVPPRLVKEAISLGAEFVEDADKQEAFKEPDPKVVISNDAQHMKVKDAIKVLMERQLRGDFTASGLPDARKLSGIVGFDVSSKLRDVVWTEILEEQRESEAA